MWTIYRHTCPINGKSYIGLTSKTVNQRWTEHCRDAAKGSSIVFHRAIRKHGKDSWQTEVLVSEIPTKEDAVLFEKHFIKFYDTLNKGYNSTVGGDGVFLNDKIEAIRVKRLKESSRIRYNKVEQEFWDYSLEMKIVGISGDIEEALGLKQGTLSMVSTGKTKSRKGIALYSTYEQGYTLEEDEYELEHKEYGVVKTPLSVLCKVYNLNYKSLYKVATLGGSYNGWVRKGELNILDKTGLDPKSRKIKVTNITTGNVAFYKSLTQTEKSIGIHRHTIRDNINKVYNNYLIEEVI
jgi:group I intron endonuclease